ncbi:MAG: hypothetical protein HZC43_01015 [Nitrosomonadales bacterium]|nr:hypothetical protein [Nitrosomonadales bacterium]
MTPEDKISVEAFLDKLQSTPRGRAMAVNMFESCSESLVSPATLSAFLLDCVKASASLPANSAVEIVDDVACGKGHTKQSYLRKCKQVSFSPADTQRLSNTMNTVSLHKFILDE